MLGRLMCVKTWAQRKIDNFLKKEDGEVNIVATVVLIGIAVVLAIVFKDVIINLIKGLLNQIVPNANNAIQSPP